MAVHSLRPGEEIADPAGRYLVRVLSIKRGGVVRVQVIPRGDTGEVPDEGSEDPTDLDLEPKETA